MSLDSEHIHVIDRDPSSTHPGPILHPSKAQEGQELNAVMGHYPRPHTYPVGRPFQAQDKDNRSSLNWTPFGGGSCEVDVSYRISPVATQQGCRRIRVQYVYVCN